MIPYLSPSSYMKWQKDKAEFFLQYLAPTRPPRPAQTVQMAVGSAFDALVKTALMSPALAPAAREEELIAATMPLYLSQVEQQHHANAMAHGLDCFRTYRDTGALARIALLLDGATDISVEGDLKVEFTTNTNSFAIRGKPDLYLNKMGVPVMLDWKVNGYFSTGSPVKGYTWLSDKGAAHKNAVVGSKLGIACDVVTCLSELKEDWATQLAMYTWCSNPDTYYSLQPVLAAIDQITNRNGLRVSQYRNFISVAFQERLQRSLQACWGQCSLPPEEYCSLNKLDYAKLKDLAIGYSTSEHDPDGLIQQLCRPNVMFASSAGTVAKS